MTPMEPLPQTVEALRELESPADAGVRLQHLLALASRAKEVVPDLVGVSIARTDPQLTFTVVASAPEVAVLDAIQYAAGGPCVDAGRQEQVRESDESNVLDEERWRLFAQATAARAVRTTLTLPVMDAGGVIGTVNLYAASRRSFVGHYEELAEIFGAWPAGAITNADLSFTTRREAEAAPQRVRETGVIEAAAAVIAIDRDVDLETGEAILHDAAAQAGVTVLEVAREVLHAQDEDDGGVAPD